MVQTSAINTVDTIEESKHAEGLGADAVMVLPPYFEGPDRAGVVYHYEKVAGALKTPVMVYNIPQATNIDITPDLYGELLQVENIRYIKDSTGSLIRIQELLAVGGSVFNGADPIAFEALIAGCPGCIWGAVNAMPGEAVQLFDLVASDKLNEARDLWRRLVPAQLFFWSHIYNAAVKQATNLSGRPVGPCRDPVRPLTEDQQSGLSEALSPLGIAKSRAAAE
jgi:4-hydroxy-tetrahydrodipicolinate synthase